MKKKNITDYSEFNGKKTIIESPEQDEEFNESNNGKELDSKGVTKPSSSWLSLDSMSLYLIISKP